MLISGEGNVSQIKSRKGGRRVWGAYDREFSSNETQHARYQDDSSAYDQCYVWSNIKLIRPHAQEMSISEACRVINLYRICRCTDYGDGREEGEDSEAEIDRRYECGFLGAYGWMLRARRCLERGYI